MFVRPFLLPWLCCLGVAATAQSDAAAARELRSAIKKIDGDTADRAMAAVRALAEHDTAKAAQELIATYSKLEGRAETILKTRHERLLDGGSSARLGPSRHELQPVRDVQDEILAALGRFAAPEALQALVEPLVRARRGHALMLKLALAEHASRLTEEQLGWFAPGEASGTRIEGLLALLRATSALGPRAESAGEWAIALLEHKNVDVRREAIAACGALGYRGALRPLIEHIDRETGAMREHVFDALVVLTGRHPGNSSASWRAWLDAEGGPYLRGEKRLGHGDSSQRDRKQFGGTTAGSYFGIEQTGEAILYVVDVSLSMRGAGAGRQRGGDAPTTGVESKWVRCKKELQQALESLPPNRTFNIVTFANHVRRFEDRMQPATEDSVESAIAWINSLQLEFETNIYDALDLSFWLAGRGVKDRYYQSEIDTIFFLSDGAPTIPRDPKAANQGGRGNRRIEQDVPEKILSAVRRWNALRRVTIHTIGIGLPQGPRGGARRGSRPVRFLAALAEQNGGRFVNER